MVSQVPVGGLTPVEESLVERVGRGEWLDLAAGDEAVDEAAMRSWGESRACRASVIRDILRGRLAADPDPHGLRLRGARITGRLDLENVTADVHLELRDCLLEEGVLAQSARLAFVGLTGCQIEHPTEPPLGGARLTCSALCLDGAKIIGHAGGGAVDLSGARIGGTLDCIGVQLRNDSGPALNAEGLHVEQNMLLRGGFAAGSGDAGAVRLFGARIGGQLVCSRAELGNDSGPALNAESVQVEQGIFLRGLAATGSGGDGAVRLLSARIGQLVCTGAQLRNDSGPALTADSLHVDQAMSLSGEFTGSGGDGAVRLPGARIGSELDCTGAQLRNDSGPALTAFSLQVGHAMLLSGGFTATGGGEDAAVDLTDAQVGGTLDCIGVQLRNDSGPALNAEGLHVEQNMLLRGGFAAGSGDAGAVRLFGARIGGQLVCSRAELGNDSGPALNAESVQVEQGIFLRGLAATGSGGDGAVRLLSARIGQLVCTGAQLRNDSGPALTADSLHVDQAMSLSGEFTGSGGDGAVRLPGARIGSELDCTGAQLRNDSGPALTAFSLQVGHAMLLSGGFTATGGGEDAAVDLTDAQVGGTFVFAPKRLEHMADSRQLLAVDGLTYPGVPETRRSRDWRDLLRHATPGYAAQPYQQLAAGYRARGDDRQARKTLMDQRDDQLARTDTSWRERWWGQITKVTLGYGYQPWRALLFLAGVVAVSCVLAVVLGAHGALAQASRTATPGRSCTVVQQVSVGLDLNLPVGTSVARADCDLTTDSASATAAWLTAIGWVLRVLAWVFAALFIAGFTSAVRKT